MIQAKGLDEVFDLDSPNIELLPAEGSEHHDIVESNEGDNLPQTIQGEVSDSQFIRNEIKDLIERSKEALTSAIEAQNEEETPKRSEAIAALADSINKNIESLMKLNKLEVDINAKKAKEVKKTGNVPQNMTQNNVIITTSNDMIQDIVNKIKGNNDE